MLFLILLAYSCNESQESSNGVTPLMPQADTQMSVYTIDASEGGMISFPSGTSIDIPANAFVDAEGKVITGPVEIEYREFHRASSILASGIPMEYTENGKTYSFQTAGMFEIQGYTKGIQTMQVVGRSSSNRVPVFIAKGKSISTNVASFVDDTEEYNFYFFNEDTGEWEYREPSNIKPNNKKKEALDAVAPLVDEPVQPRKFNINTPVLNLELDVKEFPELDEFKGILWEYAGEGEGHNPHSAENAEKLSSIEWGSIDVEPTTQIGVYKVVFSNTKLGEEFVTELSPVLRGKNYERAIKRFEKKMEKFQEAKTKRLLAEERLAAQGNFFRMANINRFGIYNHDKYFKQNDLITCNASFRLSTGEAVTSTVYLMGQTDRALIKYPPSSWGKFALSPSDAVLVSILEDGKLAVMSKDELSMEPLEQGASHEFVMNVEKEVESAEDLSAVMASLW